MDSIWTNLKNGTTPIGSSAGERSVPVDAQARFVYRFSEMRHLGLSEVVRFLPAGALCQLDIAGRRPGESQGQEGSDDRQVLTTGVNSWQGWGVERATGFEPATSSLGRRHPPNQAEKLARPSGINVWL